MLLPEIPLQRSLGWFSSCRKDPSPLLIAIFLSRTQKWAIKSIWILGKFLPLHQVQPSPFLPSSFSLSWPFSRESFLRVRFLGWCWNSCATKGVEAPSLGSFPNHCITPQKAQSGWVRQSCQKAKQALSVSDVPNTGEESSGGGFWPLSFFKTLNHLEFWHLRSPKISKDDHLQHGERRMFT